ncbi:MAG TPA: SLC13 family permease, partial [Arenimonas sp.]|nr:SLC13 family permease [Arenimonas sp.]
MTWQAWLTVAVILATLGLLLWERFPPARIMLGAVTVLVLTGVLGPMRALAGFVNPGVLTVALLFVLVAALKRSGAMSGVATAVLGRSSGLLMAQARLLFSSAGLSAFVNNTPVVATRASAVVHWSRDSRIPASKLLLPMNYATILGGLCTLIGTSTNLVVAGLVKAHPELPELHLFTPLPVGICVALVGIGFLLLASRWLLPVRRTSVEQVRDAREFAVTMQVEAGGPLVGKRIDHAGLRHLGGSFLVELGRGGELLVAVTPDTVLRGGDRLVFVGGSDSVAELRRIAGLRLADEQDFDPFADGGRRHLVEVVLAQLSPLVGKTLREAKFRDSYGAAVLALSRHGQRLHQKLGEVALHPGDTLLLETTPAFLEQHAESHDFLLVNRIDDLQPVRRGLAARALSVLLAMILANTVFGVDILLSAACAAVLVVVLGCVDWRDALRSIDVPLLTVIACSFALGAATEVTGLAAEVAGQLLGLASADPFWTLVLVYVAAVLFTELLTNNAAAVLVFPIGLAAAAQLGVSAMPFVMAVMVGASCGFITPIGYHTNLIVYGPGGYRFSDYIRLGAPLNLV